MSKLKVKTGTFVHNVLYLGLKRPGQDFSWEKSAEKYLSVYTKRFEKMG